jgi:hypothetical protein
MNRSGMVGLTVLCEPAADFFSGPLCEGGSSFSEFFHEDGEGLVARSIGTTADRDLDWFRRGGEPDQPGTVRE